MSVNSNCQTVSGAVKAVAKSMKISEEDALRVLVSRGAQDVANTLSSGVGLDGVRVQTASPGANGMGAEAYASGRSLNIPAGPRLPALGHEVTHTIQQSTRRIEAATARNSTR